MPAYLVKKLPSSGSTRINNVKGMIVFAVSVSDARLVAKGEDTGDSDNAWDNADVIEVLAAPDMEGYIFRLRIYRPASVQSPSIDIIDLEVVGSSSDGVEDMKDKMVVALNNHSLVSGADNVSPNQMNIAGGGSNLGRHGINAEFFRPGQRNRTPMSRYFNTFTTPSAPFSILTGGTDLDGFSDGEALVLSFAGATPVLSRVLEKFS